MNTAHGKGGSRTALTEFANIANMVGAKNFSPLRWRAWAKKFLALQVVFSYFLLLCSTSAGAAVIKFEYDQAGNMVSGQGKYYEYNAANQLIKVRKDAPSGSVIAEYVYDYQGQRVKKIENGITTYYIGKHYEERKGNTVNEKTNYIFANGQRVAARIVKDNKPAAVSYYLNNHLGSADVVTDAQGNVTERLRYYPYGEYRTQPNPKERHAYTGKERDEATQEYYYEARYYNPSIARFTQADTITPNLYDPQSLNRYSYVCENPISYIDPTGHSRVSSWILRNASSLKPYAKNVGNGIKKGAGVAWSGTKEYSSKAWSGTKEYSGKAWGGTKEYSSKAWGKTKEYAGKGYSSAKNFTKDVSKDIAVEYSADKVSSAVFGEGEDIGLAGDVMLMISTQSLKMNPIGLGLYLFFNNVPAAGGPSADIPYDASNDIKR